MAPKEAAPTISEETRISLGVILAVCSIFGVAIIAGVFWVGVTVTQINTGIAQLRDQIGSAWTVDNQKLWAAQMQAGNPSLKIPDPDATKGKK